MSGSRSPGGVVAITVNAGVAGHVGLRREYSDGCLLVERSVRLDGVAVSVAPLALEEVGTMLDRL